MADLSKIKLNGITYNFKDGWARSAIANINPFNIEIVNSLPVSNIDLHTFYLIPNNGTGQNIYDEYLYVNNNWEKLGSINAGSIDLTNYLKTTDIAAWAKEPTKPSYTAAEVGALPDTTVIPAAQVQSNWNATTGMGVILNKPTTVSSFTNDAGYLTLSTLPIYDGTVV